jgi:hypothetical protein
MARRGAPSITDHDAASRASADLCDRLYTLLGQRIERLQRSKVGRWCCSFPEGENKFAYVTHRKRKRRLEVWFAGAEGSESRFPQRDIRPRSATDSGWQRFNFRFYVEDLSQAIAAADLLTRGRAASPVHVEQEDLTDDEIDDALRANCLRIGIVPTDNAQSLARQRKGQARIRALTLENYGARCAVCDVADPALLIASHIVGWAEAPEHRGNLSNVVCLCRIHDALFEAGYWSLADDLQLVKKRGVPSRTIRGLLDQMSSFRSPVDFRPGVFFVKCHGERHNLTEPNGTPGTEPQSVAIC